MHAHGHTHAWGTHISEGAPGAARMVPAAFGWWESHHAARREAKLAALSTHWDAHHEVIVPEA